MRKSSNCTFGKPAAADNAQELPSIFNDKIQYDDKSAMKKWYSGPAVM